MLIVVVTLFHFWHIDTVIAAIGPKPAEAYPDGIDEGNILRSKRYLFIAILVLALVMPYTVWRQTIRWTGRDEDCFPGSGTGR